MFYHLYSVMNTEQYEECIHVSGRSSEEIKPVILSIVELHLAKEISVSQWICQVVENSEFLTRVNLKTF